MNIADMFRNVLGPTGQVQTEQKPNAPAGGDQKTESGANKNDAALDSNGKPIQPGQENNPNNFKSPLDLYSKMFDTKNDEVAVAPRFAIDPKILGEASKSLNFSQKVLTADLREKIKAGDMDALASAMDALGQEAYSTALQHTSVLTDKFVEASLKHSQSGLGKSVRGELLKNSLTKDLPTDNPVVANGLKMISENLSKAFPDAAPDWLAQKSREFFMEMAKAMDPKASAKPDAKDQPGDFDWDKWLAEQTR